MDFGTLLQTAKQNEQNKTDRRTYNTKWAPPKKQEKKATALSANIQKFLARKEEEEKRKQVEADRKRDQLYALRAQDGKAKRRVNVMLKRTKSANQSVLADAVNEVNTAVTMAGPSQPDEDDYGYVSKEASAYYDKLMERYNNTPDDPKFANFKRKTNSGSLASTKDRVRAALEREREEANMPHKRKRRKTEGAEDKKTEEEPLEEEEKRPSPFEIKPAKPKPKIAAPPPMSFHDLLKLAEKKKDEPIVIESKVKEKSPPPMTKKQKKEHERVEQWRSKKSTQASSISESTAAQPIGKIPKLNGSDPAKIQKVKSSSVTNVSSMPESQKLMHPDKRKSIGGNSNNDKPSVPTSRDTNISQKSALSKPPLNRSSRPDHSAPIGNTKKVMDSAKPKTNSSTTSSFNKGDLAPSSPLKKQTPPHLAQKSVKKPSISSNNSNQPKKFPPPDVSKPKQFPPSDIRPKQFPPSDIRPKQFPPSDIRPKQFPPPDVRPKQFPPSDMMQRRPAPSMNNKKRKMVIDSEDEYDSEMDDFIDDGPEDIDISQHIKAIFGYDKSKYRGEKYDDDECMESSFVQQMKEDARSARLGLLEDLEDIKKEKEEKRRKAIKMKNMK